jgi:ApaG protein
MEVICHRLGSKESALALTGIDHIGPQLAHKTRWGDTGRPRGCALERNYVETAMKQAATGAAGRSDDCSPRFLGYDARQDFRKLFPMYRAITRQIEVTVEPNFMPDRPATEKGQYFWSYTIVITNTGAETVQLRSRHWVITDATGRKQEVRGEGVVGEQPVLAPGERFEYTSGVPLPTASGFMTGRYQMVTARGERFEIDVPTFSLDCPAGKRVLN